MMAPTTVSGRARALKLAAVVFRSLDISESTSSRVFFLIFSPTLGALPKADWSTFSARTGTDKWEELATPAQVTQLARDWPGGAKLGSVSDTALASAAPPGVRPLPLHDHNRMNYNDAPGYLAVWGAELCGMAALIFRL